jgi:hypothetical protein
MDYCRRRQLKRCKVNDLAFEYKLLRVYLLHHLRPVFGVVLEVSVCFNERATALASETEYGRAGSAAVYV